MILLIWSIHFSLHLFKLSIEILRWDTHICEKRVHNTLLQCLESTSAPSTDAILSIFLIITSVTSFNDYISFSKRRTSGFYNTFYRRIFKVLLIIHESQPISKNISYNVTMVAIREHIFNNLISLNVNQHNKIQHVN